MCPCYELQGARTSKDLHGTAVQVEASISWPKLQTCNLQAGLLLAAAAAAAAADVAAAAVAAAVKCPAHLSPGKQWLGSQCERCASRDVNGEAKSSNKRLVQRHVTANRQL